MKPSTLAGILAAVTAACAASSPAGSPQAAVRIACTTLPVGSTPAAGTSGQHPGWDLPPVRGRLYGVAAGSPRSALAVGFTGVLGGLTRALVARWNGTAWKTLSSRALPPASYLEGVALFPDGAWAVGEKDIAGRDYSPLIVRVTGTTLRQVRAPPGTGDGSGLWAVAATSAADAWAGGIVSFSSPLIVHWNGTAWTRARLPATVTRGGYAVTGMAATSRTNAWAVMLSAGRLPLIVHWNGRRWDQVAAPDVGMRYDLNSVAATSATNVWAAGSGAILHWNGRKRMCARPPDNLFAVATSSADNAWAVGDSGYGNGAVAWHWNGHTWKQTITPQPGTGSVLQGVAVIPPSGRDAWAVGSTGNRSLMLHWSGTAWQ